MSKNQIEEKNIDSSCRQSTKASHRKTIRIHGEKIEKRFSRKVDADKWYIEKKREKELVERGISLPKSEITVQEFAMNWLERRKLNGKPTSSWNSDEGRIRKYILPEFGQRFLNRISTKEWEMFLDDLVAKEVIAPATRNRIRSILTKMYNDGLRLEIVDNNPVRIIPKLKESMEAWNYWSSSDEIMNYLYEAKNESESFYIFACLSLNLGTRVGETLALDHSDIDLNHRRIQIAKIFEEASGNVYQRTKGHKPRWLGVNDSLFEAMLEYKNKTPFRKSNHPVVCNDVGVRLYERQIRRIHERVCKRAQVKQIRVHDLRHTYASHYIMNGGGIAELQSLLGHSSPMMTLKYAHLAPGYLEKKSSLVSFSLAKNNVLSLNRAK